MSVYGQGLSGRYQMSAMAQTGSAAPLQAKTGPDMPANSGESAKNGRARPARLAKNPQPVSLYKTIPVIFATLREAGQRFMANNAAVVF
ncbi:hypothetical protein [Polaromonas sp.]|uniref:hypothetical protein n=1 Tax=Polaromonas sp. TaxID=1869339 RepID=UPI003BB7556A